MLLFSKLNKIIVGYFDPEKGFFYIMKINYFRGELTDNSALKEALVSMHLVARIFNRTSRD